MRGDARAARGPEAVARVVCGEARAQLLGERRAEEVVQLERGLFDEARGECGERARLEVDGVQELGEEGDVLWGERVGGQRRGGGRGVGVEGRRRGGLGTRSVLHANVDT